MLICLWMRRELEQHIIRHVSTALLEAVSCVVCVVYSSRSANTLPPRTHLFTPTRCTHGPRLGKPARGLSAAPLYEACFYRIIPTPPRLWKALSLGGKHSSFPWYLAGLMTNKPSCWCSKSKEQLTQAKQTSLINTTKCNLKSHKCKSLKNIKGACLFFTLFQKMPFHEVFLECGSCKAASASSMYHYPPLLVCKGNKPCEIHMGSIFKTSSPPHCYDPTHSALVLNKEKQYNTCCRFY